MGSKKKKTLLMTSLSRRETTVPENGNCGGVNKSIGCMAGIFHFLSRHHHNNSRKRLPSAGRMKKIVTSPSKEAPPPQLAQRTAGAVLGKDEEQPMQPTSTHAIIPVKTFCAKEIQRRHSCEVQRSPTLPSEIRRSSSVELSLDSPRRPTPLVARLMGLDEIPVSSPGSAAEKRRMLVGALDKRRRTVEAIVVDMKREEDDGDESVETVKSVDSEQPSPVSVLEAVSSPTCGSAMRLNNEKQRKPQGTALQLRAPETSYQRISGDLNKNKPETKQKTPSIFNNITIERLSPLMPKRRGIQLFEEFGEAKRLMEGSGRRRSWESKRSSHALVESVSEVWEDGLREQRWEFGRVAVGLERGIFGDLVDEFVREMLGWYFKGLVLRGSCRKRLCL